MLQHGNLTDAWAITHPTPQTNPTRQTGVVRNAQAAMQSFGLTVDTPLNTWSAGKNLDNFAKRWLGKRLDYVLYHSPSLSHPSSTGAGATSESKLCIQSTAIILTERVPGHEFSYSDHFGLEATFSITTEDHATGAVAPRLSSEDILTAIGALSHSLHASHSRTYWHTVYLATSILLLLLAIIGSAWFNTGKWNAFLAACVAAIATFGGTMAICVGILYGIRERGRLTNFIEEMECILRAWYGTETTS